MVAHLPPASAQPAEDAPIVLSLENAVELALTNNYLVRGAQLALENANAQIKGAYGQVMPSVMLASSYQRNLKTANPFAGSSAGNFFAGLGSIGWLAFNEDARTDGDPLTNPITLDEFFRRQSQGLDDAGIVISESDNPFAVDNTFFNGVSVQQTIFDWRAMLAVDAARAARSAAKAGLERQMQMTVHQVRSAYYQALLASENASVVASSMSRTAETLGDTRKRVAQGVLSKYQRLSAEVALSNLETQLIQAENAADLALNNLKLAIGIPVDSPIQLAGSLDAFFIDQGMVQAVALNDAVGQALVNRPDLQQAELAVQLQQYQRRAENASFMPRVSAFANFNYSGRVPDNRTGYITDPDDPFKFSPTSESFFSSSYWNPDVNVGVTLSWTLFDGFQRKSRIQQQRIGVQQRELAYEQMYQAIRNEVDATVKNVESASRRIFAQQQNTERAELNYTFASTRLQEGVSSNLEERQASDLLDQSRVGYLQAIHDYLVALSDYYTALGIPLQMTDSNVNITAR
jgi:outer membrane protein TolC